MQFKEITQDLFESDANTYLAHCVSSDLVLGAGIAKSFRNRGVRDYLLQHNKRYWNAYGYALFAPMEGFNGVFNLVTKHYYYDKPTYRTLRESLIDMKRKLPNDCNLNMPCIGSGLDKLNWNEVRDIIKEVFSDTDVNITICKL